MSGEGTLRPACAGCNVPMVATAVRQRVEDRDGEGGQLSYVRLYQVSYLCGVAGCGQTAIKGWYRGETLPMLLNPRGTPSVLWL